MLLCLRKKKNQLKKKLIHKLNSYQKLETYLKNSFYLFIRIHKKALLKSAFLFYQENLIVNKIDGLVMLIQ